MRSWVTSSQSETPISRPMNSSRAPGDSSTTGMTPDGIKLLPPRTKAESARVEFERRGEVFGEVAPVMAAGIEMKLVGNGARNEQVVKGLSADVESEVIFGAAVEVEGQTHGAGAIAYEGEGRVALPKRRVKRISERGAQKPQDAEGILAVE